MNFVGEFEICMGALAVILLVVDGPLKGVAIGRGHGLSTSGEAQHNVHAMTEKGRNKPQGKLISQLPEVVNLIMRT